MFQPQIWKSHKKRDDFTECPHCGKPLRWIYDGILWYPCDREPTMFILHPTGKNQVLYNRKLYENCLIYRKGDPRFDGVHPLSGNVQHYYTCPVLRSHRKEYIQSAGIR